MHDDHAATLFVALDLSRSSWVAAVHAPHAAGKVSRHKLAPAGTGSGCTGRCRRPGSRTG